MLFGLPRHLAPGLWTLKGICMQGLAALSSCSRPACPAVRCQDNPALLSPCAVIMSDLDVVFMRKVRGCLRLRE